MVPGGPRPRNCGVGHAPGRRVSPWCLEIQVERFIGAAPIAAECNFQELQALARLFCVFTRAITSRTRTAGGPSGGNAILHCGPRGLAGSHGRLQKHAKQPNI